MGWGYGDGMEMGMKMRMGIGMAWSEMGWGGMDEMGIWGWDGWDGVGWMLGVGRARAVRASRFRARSPQGWGRYGASS